MCSTRYYKDDQIDEIGIGGACSKCRKAEKYIKKTFVGRLETVVVVMNKLTDNMKWTSKKLVVRVWTRFICCGTGASVLLSCEHEYVIEPSGSIKGRELLDKLSDY